jgi:hypothetical protein
MPLTAAQIATLKGYVQGSVDAQIVDARTRGDTFLLAQLLNKTASPAVSAWRTSVQPQESDAAPSYSAFDSIVAGKRDSWGFFLRYARDFSKNKVRTWITDVWGSATAGSNAEAILQTGTENASVAENAIGGANKSTGTVAALDRGFVGQVSQADCQQVLA